VVDSFELESINEQRNSR